MQLAGGAENIKFMPVIQNSQELAKLVAGAKGFIFPSLEPFGIAPIEALSAGVPVIAYHDGGALDYIVDGKNGVFFNEQTVESLTDAIEKAEGIKFNKKYIQYSAQQFSRDDFIKKLENFIKEKLLER